jgi:nitrate/nitrite transporter NarK
MWCLCAQQFCRAAGYIFFASWFATYLQEARGVTIIGSGWLTTLPLLADVTGCMFGGVLSDAVLRWTGNQRLARQGLSAIALLLCAGLIFSAWFVAQPVMAVLVISAGMFCAATANPCLGATVMSLGGPHVATVSATANMCGNLGAAAFPIAVPWLLAHAGGWNAVLGGFGALYIIAAAFWLMMKAERVA